ncbi:hypothetical protein U1Q18_016120 [Sarracenia purpurea var. burkii]
MQVQNPTLVDSLMQEATSIQDVKRKSFREILFQPKIKDKPFDSDAENILKDEMLDEAQESSTTIDQELSKATNGAPIVTIPKKLIMRARQQWMDCLILKLLGKSIDYKALVLKATQIWRLQGAFEITDLGLENGN